MVHLDDATKRLELVRYHMQQGWQIDAPVLGRHAYLDKRGSIRAVEVVLSRSEMRQVVALPDTASVREFLHQYGLNVIDV